jgi:hypothetical protein
MMTVLWSAGYNLCVRLARTWPGARWARRLPLRALLYRRRMESKRAVWAVRVRCAAWEWGWRAAPVVLWCLDGEHRRRWLANRGVALDRIAADFADARARHAARWKIF